MVWPFSSPPSNNNDTTPPANPYSKLDPSLRQILSRESPSSNIPPPPQQPTLTAIQQPPPPQEPPQPNSPSPPTLYPDGRYAHLWKTYQPQTRIEASQKSDQERLADVLIAWKDRNASISKAALENCAAVNMELDACLRSGTLAQRLTMCRTESKALDRCISMNTRFLKTLGYLSSLERSREEQEAVQMHADRLYVGMLEREEKGGERVDDDVVVVRPVELERLTEMGKRLLEERVRGLSGAERELEERAFAAEVRAGKETMEQVEKFREEARQARAKRIESGKARPSDRLQSWLGK